MIKINLIGDVGGRPKKQKERPRNRIERFIQTWAVCNSFQSAKTDPYVRPDGTDLLWFARWSSGRWAVLNRAVRKLRRIEQEIVRKYNEERNINDVPLSLVRRCYRQYVRVEKIIDSDPCLRAEINDDQTQRAKDVNTVRYRTVDNVSILGGKAQQQLDRERRQIEEKMEEEDSNRLGTKEGLLYSAQQGIVEMRDFASFRVAERREDYCPNDRCDELNDIQYRLKDVEEEIRRNPQDRELLTIRRELNDELRTAQRDQAEQRNLYAAGGVFEQILADCENALQDGYAIARTPRKAMEYGRIRRTLLTLAPSGKNSLIELNRRIENYIQLQTDIRSSENLTAEDFVRMKKEAEKICKKYMFLVKAAKKISSEYIFDRRETCGPPAPNPPTLANRVGVVAYDNGKKLLKFAAVVVSAYLLYKVGGKVVGHSK